MIYFNNLISWLIYLFNLRLIVSKPQPRPYSNAFNNYYSPSDYHNYDDISQITSETQKGYSNSLFNNLVDHYGCEQRLYHEPILSRAARCTNDPANIRKLLAQPNLKSKLNEKEDYYKTTPLHIAAMYQDKKPYEVTKELILNGANITSKNDEFNRTPVICAGENINGGVATLKALLEDYTKYRQDIENYKKIEELNKLKQLEKFNKLSDQEREKLKKINNQTKKRNAGPSEKVLQIVRAEELKLSPDDHYFTQKSMLLDTDINGNNIYHTAAAMGNYRILKFLKRDFKEVTLLAAVVVGWRQESNFHTLVKICSSVLIFFRLFSDPTCFHLSEIILITHLLKTR